MALFHTRVESYLPNTGFLALQDLVLCTCVTARAGTWPKLEILVSRAKILRALVGLVNIFSVAYYECHATSIVTSSVTPREVFAMVVCIIRFHLSFFPLKALHYMTTIPELT